MLGRGDMEDTVVGDPQYDPAASEAEKRRQRWIALPSPVALEDMTTSAQASLPPPDVVFDPDHEFMIRHAG